MNINKHFQDRVNHLFELSDKTLASNYTGGRYNISYVREELFREFETSSLSFIINLYGEKHPYYASFRNNCKDPYPSHVQKGRGVLASIKTEIEKGWLIKIKTLVSAEIFSDFLDMARYFLDENYKDPAAVMIGSVLEENLRQIANKNSVDILFVNNKGDTKPKKADTINADLCKAGVYSLLDQKQITAWLDLRNKAAHGEYDKYTLAQVELMYQGVLNFITRVNS